MAGNEGVVQHARTHTHIQHLETQRSQVSACLLSVSLSLSLTLSFSLLHTHRPVQIDKAAPFPFASVALGPKRDKRGREKKKTHRALTMMTVIPVGPVHSTNTNENGLGDYQAGQVLSHHTHTERHAEI